MRARLRRASASLAVRTFLAGALVLVLVFVLLLVTPVEVSYPIRFGEVAVLAGGLLAMLAVQLLLARRALAPLRRLAAQMENIDLREPSQRLAVAPDQGPMISAFVGAFNTMLERLAAERRQSARAALGAQEAERLRTARELHDEVGQSLTAVALQVERLAAEADPSTAAPLEELARQLQRTLEDIRRLVRELRPEALDDLGLVSALIALTARIGRQAEIRLERELSGDLPPLSPDQELVVYRVAQESLTNVVRHAEANMARVVLGAGDGEVVLVVSDDGRGMRRGNSEASSGIEGMRERALLVGARLSIESEPGQGTEVKLVMPVETVI